VSTDRIRIKVISAFPQDEAGITRRREKLSEGIVDAGTEVDFVGIRRAGVLLMDSYYNLALHEPFIVQAGLGAEEEGYDAVVVDTVTDLGVNAIRSRLSIPVVGPGQAGYATATMLGRRFSILTRWTNWRFLHDASLDAYGLRSRCASIRAPRLSEALAGSLSGLTAAQAAAVMEERDDYWDAFVSEARAAVDEDGADVIVLASMTMQRAAELLRGQIDVPVIDPGPLAIRTAETLVRLGLAHSKAAFQAPTRLHDEDFRRLRGAE
jgi:allantoin racemase